MTGESRNSDLTAVFYTCNVEGRVFEKRIVESLVEAAGDTPIVSVSQQPMRLGNNICVGDVGASTQNAYMQLLIGAETATTKWVCTALADTVYPPEYFQFRPPREDKFYIAKPLWVFFFQRRIRKRFYRYLAGFEGAMVCSRRLLINRVRATLEPIGGSWGGHDSADISWNTLLHKDGGVRDAKLWLPFRLDNPCVTVKTNEQMHRRAPISARTKANEIPYWGTAEQFRGRFFR